MRVGSIIRADNSGLGTLAREFWDNGLIQKALIHPNGVYRVFPERFPGARISKDLSPADVDWLLEGIDTLYFFETPFDWSVIPRARARGIRTILMPMHECLPERLPYSPDLYHCVSSLEMDLGLTPSVYIPIPVNTERVRWQERRRARVFVHNAGHGGLNGRNGTAELVEALQHAQAPFRLVIRSQAQDLRVDDPRVECRFMNAENYWDLWGGEGDVFIFPEKFNGLSLPIQEAAASGMLVMSTDRRPFSEWLPKEPLIPKAGVRTARISRPVEESIIDPKAIARKMDDWYDKDITKYSLWGKKWAEEHSWQRLRGEYAKLLAP